MTIAHTMGIKSHSIQHSDFSVTEGGPLSPSDAVELLHDSVWEDELTRCSPEEEAGSEWCPPNFTIYAEDGSYFQVCFVPDSKPYYVYSFKERWIAFLPFSRRKTRESAKKSREEIERALQYFYDGRSRHLK